MSEMNYNPPFCVINDEAYDRMFATLQRNEERYVKSYLHMCPHQNKDECKCKFYMNFLKDGKMVRVMNGELKDVLKESDLKKLISSKFNFPKN
jgi:hypothetical protein